MLPVLESLFYKDAGLWPATLLKMTLAQVSSCKFWEFLRKSFLQNTFGRLLQQYRKNIVT